MTSNLGEESVRRLAKWVIAFLRKNDFPSLKRELQSYTDNHSDALASPKYIVQEATTLLPNEQATGALASGYLKNTTATGVLSVQAPPIPASDGGTGQSSYTVGDILYASAAAVLSKLAAVAAGNALISGGASTAPSWGKIGLTTHVSGILPSANGGTGINNGSNTLTVPASGTAALIGTANTFTQTQIFANGAVHKQTVSSGETVTIPEEYAMSTPTKYRVDGKLHISGRFRVG